MPTNRLKSKLVKKQETLRSSNLKERVAHANLNPLIESSIVDVAILQEEGAALAHEVQVEGPVLVTSHLGEQFVAMSVEFANSLVEKEESGYTTNPLFFSDMPDTPPAKPLDYRILNDLQELEVDEFSQKELIVLQK